MGRFIRFWFGVALAPLFVAFVWEAVVLTVEDAGFFLRSPVTYGFLAYLLVYALASRQVVLFLEVLEHEFGHAIAALLSFRQVSELTATPQGGETHVAPLGTCVTLFPYCLPLLLLPLLALCFLIPPPVSYAVDALIGFVLGFHLVGLFRTELRFGQPDLVRVGYLFSLGVIGALNAALLVVVYGVVSSRPASIVRYLTLVYRRTLFLYQAILGWLGALIAG